MTSTQTSTSLSHGGGGTWGFSGGVKPSGIIKPLDQGGRSYRFQELFDAIQKIDADRSQVPGNSDPASPVGLVAYNFLADPTRAVFDLRGLIDGGHVGDRAIGVALVAAGEALNQASILDVPHTDALTAAAAERSIPDLRAFLLGRQLRRVCRPVKFSLLARIRARVRMTILKWVSPSRAVFDELEDLAWILYGTAVWAQRCRKTKLAIAILHELARVAKLARKLHHTTPVGIGDAADTMESSVAENVAWQALHSMLNALDDRTREQFLAEFSV